MSRVGKKIIEIPSGVDAHRSPASRSRSRDRRASWSMHLVDGIGMSRSKATRRRSSSRSPGRTVARRAPRHDAREPGQHGQGRERGLQEDARDRRHRLPREHGRQEARAAARLLAPGRVPRARGHHAHGGDADQGHDRRHRQGAGRPDGREHPRASARPSRTRARASSTRASTSAARPASRPAPNRPPPGESRSWLVQDQAGKAAASGAIASARRWRAPPSVRASPCTAA